HKLLLSLSTGGVAVHFVTLTGTVNLALSKGQKIIVLGAMFSMALASVSGIINWRADCRRNYLWASALQCEEKEKRNQLFRLRDRHLFVEKIPGRLFIVFFFFGIMLSAIYTASRIIFKG